MIKAIIFDCFGVLTTDLWKEFKATLPENLQLPAHELNHAYDAGFITEQEFVSKINDLTGKNPGEVEALPKGEATKNKELLSYISTLKPRYTVGMLSNIATNWVRDEFLTKDEQTLFDDMLFSYEVKLTKPDPRIFKIVCERLNVFPEEAVLVDDIDRYCQSAREVGMSAVVYQNFAQMKKELEKILERG